MDRSRETLAHRSAGRRQIAWPAACALIVAMVVALGCDSSSATAGPSGIPAATAVTATASPPASTAAGGAVSGGGPPATIPQPPVEGLDVAPDSARVDIAMPSFTDPTSITNPLFPISLQESVLMLGEVDGKPFRTEVTLLPETRVIDWQGIRVETLVSQYNAYLDGTITEIAYDYYAQADDGSVWYFGEDVFDFRDGAIIVTEGTWLAGRDGPAAMIMPGDPKVGDVYRPENAPGFVFEQVTVDEVGKTLDGPLGPIEGGIVANELHMDGATERKMFAPGYGEFLTGGTGGDVEALALAVPTNSSSDPLPAELATLSSAALDVFDAGAIGDWTSASGAIDEMSTAWETYRAGDVPRLIEPILTRGLGVLTDAVKAQDPAATRSAAIDVARSAFDLQLRYRPAVEVDLARLDLWAAQLLVDATADDAAAVAADAFALDYVRDRVRDGLASADLSSVNADLGKIQGAIIDEDLAAAGEAAQQLRETIAKATVG